MLNKFVHSLLTVNDIFIFMFRHSQHLVKVEKKIWFTEEKVHSDLKLETGRVYFKAKVVA